MGPEEKVAVLTQTVNVGLCLFVFSLVMAVFLGFRSLSLSLAP
jgi:hypothetical protein